MNFRFAILAFLLAAVPLYGQSGQSSDQGAKQQTAKPTPEQANPFPEEQSRKAAEGSAPVASSGKQPAPDYSSSHVNMKSLDPDADRETRISDGAGGYIHNPELAAKDDKVGGFYMQTGDYKGAYDRYKEATEVAPEDGDAVFGLAVSAHALHRDQEARQNYQIYLDAFPDGKKAKEARKALASLKTDARK